MSGNMEVLEDILPFKVNQIQKDKDHMFSFINSSLKVHLNVE
jgi:hypothetical protein